MKSSWIDRIKQIESLPPEKGWDQIAASLDESFNGHQFPGKLYNFETAPPANAWNKIQKSLSEQTAPVIPLKRDNIRPLFIRYAMAACLIGLISFAAIKFFSFNKIKADVAVTKPVLTPQNNLPADSNSESNKSSVRAEVEKDGDSHALEESKHTYARLDMPSRSLLNKISVRLYSSPVQLSSSLSAEMGLEKNPEIQYSHRAAVNDFPGDKKDATRYLMFKDSEGRFIKISKKLTNLFCCVSGEEQDDNCNDQLKKWRAKIASSSFIPSPDNFMDILDLVSSLQDSRN